MEGLDYALMQATKHDLYEFRHGVLTWLGHVVDI